ncbi:MAG TPA: carboxylate--amine ligase, partial [Turneriella sp.]|nr:carboxylate--amine ligase [Turneriella sp.]
MQRTVTAMAEVPQPLLQAYSALPDTYDELLDASGNPREKYKFLLNSYQEIGEAELELRQRELARLLKENGVTYNVYGNQDEKARLWSLDMMPYLMESTEFSALERGLLQ